MAGPKPKITARGCMRGNKGRKYGPDYITE